MPLHFDPSAVFRFGLRARNPVVGLNFHPLDARIGLDLRARDAVVGLNLDPLDVRIGFHFHPIACLHELLLQATDSILGVGFHAGDTGVNSGDKSQLKQLPSSIALTPSFGWVVADVAQYPRSQSVTEA